MGPSLLHLASAADPEGPHQRGHGLRFPDKVFATDLENPDFVALAKAYGLHSALVERTQDYAAAFETAVNCGGAALLALRIDPQAITPRTTLAALRDKALRKS